MFVFPLHRVPTNKKLRSVCGTVLVGFLLTTVASGQGSLISWELVGDAGASASHTPFGDVAFRAGHSEDGSSDTLIGVTLSGVYSFFPSDSLWRTVCVQAICGADRIVVTKEGFLIAGAGAGPSSFGVRSVDGGRTWEHDVIGTSVLALFQSTLPALQGAVYSSNLAFVQYSTSGGERGTWVDGGQLGGEPRAFVEIPVSPQLPEGRLVAGTMNGAVYSDDGGVSWSNSDLFGAGFLSVNSVTFAPDASADYGGAVYAGVRDFQLGHPSIYKSSTGGATWVLVRHILPGDFGFQEPQWPQVYADGKNLFVGVEHIVTGNNPSEGIVILSSDGGDSWFIAADSTNGWGGYGPQKIVSGRDGRLYVPTDRGVWRTVDPVPTSIDDQSSLNEEARSLGLSVVPNPVQNEARLLFTLSQPETVRVAVYDVSGRLVKVVGEGYRSGGSHAISFSIAGFAAGTYFATVTVGDADDQPGVHSVSFAVTGN